MLDLLALIKTIPMSCYENIGFAVGWDEVFKAMKMHGFDNKDSLNFELERLKDAGFLQLFYLNGWIDGPIYAIRIK